MNAIAQFLKGEIFAVVGASQNRNKFGNKVLRSYLQHGRQAIPIHPKCDEIEGQKAYPDLMSLPHKVHGVSIITPPAVSETIIQQAVQLGIKHIWFQPGAENQTAVDLGIQAGANIIHGGPCLLVELGFPK